MYTSLFAAALLAGSAIAAPTSLKTRQTTNIDPTILQFALTLEHLENAFYRGALQNFSQHDFQQAGYDSTYYNNLKYISYDEQSHVAALSAALTSAGYTPVQPCIYNFPYTDVTSFITLSSVLEGVGTSAYLGAAPLVTSKGYLTVAGSILVTEALHTSYQRAAIKEVPMANPYGTPIDPMSAYTLAAAFIVSCPAYEAQAVPFSPFPGLTYDAPAAGQSSSWKGWHSDSWNWSGKEQSSGLQAGSTAKFTATKPVPAGSYLTFVSGLNVVSVKGTISGSDISAAVPSVALGQTYVFVTSMDVEGTLTDSSVLFGPSIIEVAPPAPALNYAPKGN